VHQSSLDKMRAFVAEHLAARRGAPLAILDLGSMDVNGSYRSLFDDPLWRYQGVDLAPGRNVDIVLADPYRWREIPAGSQDVIVSGQAFEHIEFFWVTLQQMTRALRPGGLICLIAPSRGYEHRYPVDCWRFYPDAFQALARYTGLELVSATTQWEPLGYTQDDSDDWGDSVSVMRKPERLSLRVRSVLALRRWVDRLPAVRDDLPPGA
jgi:SAM-dependent methyltransferase